MRLKEKVRVDLLNFLKYYYFLNITAQFVSIKAVGNDAMSEMCRDIVGVFKPLIKLNDVNMKLCLPHPHRPDSFQNTKILCLIFISWLLLFLEPYAMRIRYFIMKNHYPERTLERTIWLYHRILRKRTSFLQFTSQRIQRKFSANQSLDDKSMTVYELLCTKLDRLEALRVHLYL